MANGFRRILLIRRKALGDALVTMPAVQEVVGAWPEARVDLVIDRPFAGLIAALAPEVNVVSWPPPKGSWVNRLRSANYDLVIDWLGNPRTALWTLLTGAAVRVGYDLPQRRWAYNVKVPRNRDFGTDLCGFAGEAFLDPLRSLGLHPKPWRPGFASQVRDNANAIFKVSPEVEQWTGDWLARPGVPVVVIMSATWPAKMWPAHNVAQLLAALPAIGANPALVTGPGDDWLLESFAGAAGGPLLAPPTSLAELAFVVGQAGLFVGTDCGPRHLAAALGKPTVTIFGPTDPAGWNPPTPEHVSVQNPVPCAPCDLTTCPVAGHPCLADLKSETVIAKVETILTQLREGSNHAG